MTLFILVIKVPSKITITRSEQGRDRSFIWVGQRERIINDSANIKDLSPRNIACKRKNFQKNIGSGEPPTTHIAPSYYTDFFLGLPFIFIFFKYICQSGMALFLKLFLEMGQNFPCQGPIQLG